MSLPVVFHRAASAEFIEASMWYETKRVGLALEFMAEIDRCVSLASKRHLQFAIVREDIPVRPISFRRFKSTLWPGIVVDRGTSIRHGLTCWRLQGFKG